MAVGLLGANAGDLVLGLGLGHEVVHARLPGDGRGGQRVVAGDHDGADAHATQLVEAGFQAGLDRVLEFNDPQHLAVPTNCQWRGAQR
jgi:hypothetical protein